MSGYAEVSIWMIVRTRRYSSMPRSQVRTPITGWQMMKMVPRKLQNKAVKSRINAFLFNWSSWIMKGLSTKRPN